MNIAEKIAHLRIANNISQEKLASLLNVSRQSVSKWESGENLPQIDKVMELCEIFKISADDLLNDKVVIHRGLKPLPDDGKEIKTKY